VPAFEPESRSLLRIAGERSHVRSFAASFNEQVHVIRHEAVRNDCELMPFSRLLKLITDGVHGLMDLERSMSLSSAHREEIPLKPDVKGSPEPRSRRSHRSAKCKRLAGCGRAKALRYEPPGLWQG
jgi:hypothetical protein